MSRNQWEQLTKQCQLRDRPGIISSLFPGQANVRRGLGLGIVVRLWKQLRAATLAMPRLANSSGSRIAGRAPEAKASHEGGSALAAAASEGPSGTPSNSPTKWFAISQCLAWIIGSASAQLAQKAETLVLAALRKPNPPKDSGSEAKSVVSSL